MSTAVLLDISQDIKTACFELAEVKSESKHVEGVYNNAKNTMQYTGERLSELKSKMDDLESRLAILLAAFEKAIVARNSDA